MTRRAQGRELVFETRHDELRDVLGFGEIFESVHARILQRDAHGKRALAERSHGGGGENRLKT